MTSVKTRLIPAAALFAVLAMGTTQASAQVCQPITEKEVTGLFDRWNDSLKTLDPAKVTANYAIDGVLLPTVSDQARNSPTEIQDYFVSFLKDQPQGVIDKRFVRIGCNVAQDVGNYTFTFHKSGAKVSARYTYVYEYTNGKWLIAHHHSSAMPAKK